jgi:hypothetical protein
MAISTAPDVVRGRARRRAVPAALALIALLATGCAPTAWTKPGTTRAQFDQDSARCKRLADAQNTGGLYVQGTPAQVSAAILLDAIVTVIGYRESYHDCMVAAGYSPKEAAQANPINTEPPSVPVNGRWVSKDGRFEMALSSEWTPSAPTRPGNQQIRARNADGTTLVLVGRDAKASDIVGAAEAIGRRLVAGLTDSTTTPVERTTIGPYGAARFELTAQGRSERAHCLITVVQTENRVAALAGCTTDAKFIPQRDKIAAAAASLKEIAR